MSIGKSGALSADNEIGGQREFEAAGVATALNLGDHRLAQPGQALQRQHLLAQPAQGIGVRCLFQIMAGAKMLPRAGEDQHTDIVAILFDVADMGAEFAEQLTVHGVALVRTVERQRADAVGLFAQHQRHIAHVLSPRVRAMAACAVPLARARWPNCSRIGTNSGMTRLRRNQFAASTTNVWPVI